MHAAAPLSKLCDSEIRNPETRQRRNKHMKKLDKKQIPQFAALCVLSAGLFGYLVIHLVAPGPVSAGTRPPAAPAAGRAPAGQLPVAGQPASAGASPAGSAAASPAGSAAASPAGSAAAPETADADAPPPTSAMHDPFTVGYVDPATLPGSSLAALKAPTLPPAGKQFAGTGKITPLPITFPGAPSLPGSLSSFPVTANGSAPSLPPAPAAPALPPAPAAPSWTVTGVLQGADGKIAILRSGEARRIVRSGDLVDSIYRVTGVTRTSVLLRHGATVYHLVLGGIKATPAAPGATLSVPSVVPAMPLAVPAAPLESVPSSLPEPKTASVNDSTAAHGEQPGQTEKPTSASPARVASAISLGLRLLDGSVLARIHKE
jgi:hypothetical protein